MKNRIESTITDMRMALAKKRYRIYRSYANRLLAACAFDFSFTLVHLFKGFHFAPVLIERHACREGSPFIRHASWRGEFQSFINLFWHLGDGNKSVLLSIGFLEFFACDKIDEGFCGALRLPFGIHAAKGQDLVFAAGNFCE